MKWTLGALFSRSKADALRERAVLDLLAQEGPLLGHEIGKRTRMLPGFLYPVLYRLERKGVLRSESITGARLYSLVKRS